MKKPGRLRRASGRRRWISFRCRITADTAKRDGGHVRIIIEQEPGASGKALIDRYTRHVLRGYSARGTNVTGAKDIRATPVAAAAENGLITIIRNRHTNDLLDELTAFPHGPHDDCRRERSPG